MTPMAFLLAENRAREAALIRSCRLSGSAGTEDQHAHLAGSPGARCGL